MFNKILALLTTIISLSTFIHAIPVPTVSVPDNHIIHIPTQAGKNENSAGVRAVSKARELAKNDWRTDNDADAVRLWKRIPVALVPGSSKPSLFNGPASGLFKDSKIEGEEEVDRRQVQNVAATIQGLTGTLSGVGAGL